VRTGLQLRGHVVVAGRTIGRLELVIVRQLRSVEVHVAIDARELAVNRFLICLWIDVHRDRLSAALTFELRIFMAHQAVLDGLRSRRTDGGDQCDGGRGKKNDCEKLGPQSGLSAFHLPLSSIHHYMVM
jgi:hypothetical protein